MRIAIAVLISALAMPAQTKKVLLSGLTPAEVQQLRAAAPSSVKLVEVTPQTIAAELPDADAVIGGVNAAQMKAAPKLKWVQTHSAGVDTLRFPEMLSSAVTLTNAKIVMGPNIADHAFAMLLALTREIPRSLANKGSWERRTYKPVELHGKTAVVIGAGGIGMQIAQRSHGFGMRVIGVDPKDIPYTPFLVKVVPPDRLDTVLPEADVVFVAAPLTPESRGMIGPKQFGLMKKSSYFIAVSRGPLYQTDALVKALDSRHLAGAGLDVTDPEPLPPGHALWKFDNVIVTPHVAGQSDLMPARRLELFKENIRRFATGEPMLNVVDKQRGY